MRHRHIAALLTATIAWVSSMTMAPALDMQAPSVNNLADAIAVFTHLMQTSENPVVVDMARESLAKIQSQAMQPVSFTGPTPALPEAPPAPKTVTEVFLMPQTDSTFVVPTVVNKKYMATFLIDTGASYTVITPEMAKSLGINITDETEKVSVSTANGTVEAPIVMLNQVSLGGMQVNNVEAVVTDLGDSPQLSGLLGMSFFKGMEISFKNDRLLISR